VEYLIRELNWNKPHPADQTMRYGKTGFKIPIKKINPREVMQLARG
jgi:hypothetical protein